MGAFQDWIQQQKEQYAYDERQADYEEQAARAEFEADKQDSLDNILNDDTPYIKFLTDQGVDFNRAVLAAQKNQAQDARQTEVSMDADWLSQLAGMKQDRAARAAQQATKFKRLDNIGRKNLLTMVGDAPQNDSYRYDYVLEPSMDMDPTGQPITHVVKKEKAGFDENIVQGRELADFLGVPQDVVLSQLNEERTKIANQNYTWDRRLATLDKEKKTAANQEANRAYTEYQHANATVKNRFDAVKTMMNYNDAQREEILAQPQTPQEWRTLAPIAQSARNLKQQIEAGKIDASNATDNARYILNGAMQNIEFQNDVLKNGGKISASQQHILNEIGKGFAKLGVLKGVDPKTGKQIPSRDRQRDLEEKYAPLLSDITATSQGPTLDDLFHTGPRLAIPFRYTRR